ncbi:MAG: NACHT domain-containing protein [Cyanobacteria bacterium P01_F01_bin.143]
MGNKLFQTSDTLYLLIYSFTAITSLQIFWWNLTYNSQKDPSSPLFFKLKLPDQAQKIKYRKQLLARLQSDIAIRRKNSLHNLIKIDLVMEEQRHQVGGKKMQLVSQDQEINPLDLLYKIGPAETTSINAGQQIIELFDRDDIQGKLLILGEPGAGKTTELLRLAQDLIDRAIVNETSPIPMIFELSSWKNNQTIRDWLIEKLCDIYKGIPNELAAQWLDNQQLIPLLDGLDELGLEKQNQCTIAINQFLDRTFQSGLVVCSRREEYERAETKLEKLNGAIYLEYLSDEQIQQYLQSLNRSYLWNESIRNESELLELVRKPLFLTMLVVAYQGRAIRNSSELFEAYIEQQLNNPNNQGIYPPGKSPTKKQTLHYLVWLARKMEAERETEFLIEGMQTTWLESTKQKNVYRIIFRLISSLIGNPNKIQSVEKLNFSFSKYKDNLIFSLIGGLIFGLIGGLRRGLIFGLIGGLIFELSAGFSGSEREYKNFPNQGIWNSLKNGFNLGMIGLLIGGLSFALIGRLNEGFSVVLILALIFGLRGGLLTVIQHFTLRLHLYQNGYIPWNYAKFLDYAAKHRFIQRVGGRYRFMHDLLQKSFAHMKLNR